MKNILLFSTVMLVLSSCGDKTFSPDEPLVPVQKPTLYISSEGNMLYALDPKTGDVMWKHYQASGFNAEPLALGEFVFVNDANAGVLRLKAIDGSLVDTINSAVKPSGALTGEGDFIYMPASDANLVKVDYVKNEVADWASGLASKTSPIIFGNDILIAGTSQMKLIRKDDKTAITWTVNGTFGEHNPTTDGTNIFIVNGNDLTAYSYLNGAQLWTYTAPDAINTSPILYGGNIIFGCNDSKVYCIDSIAHTPRWTFETEERVFSSPYAYDQTIYIGSNDHFFYAINIDDGSLKWKFRLGGLIKSSPIAYDGMVYIGGYDKYMYGFDTTGQLKWKYLLNGLVEKSPILYDPDISKGIYPALSGLSTQ